MKRRGKVPEESRKQKQDTLVAENRKLRKEVQQLRKQLERFNGRDAYIKDLVEYMDSSEYQHEQKEKDESVECDKCYSKDTKIITTPHGIYWSCNVCDGRGKVK